MPIIPIREANILFNVLKILLLLANAKLEEKKRYKAIRELIEVKVYKTNTVKNVN